jgi:hypothetical protein
MKNGYCLSEKIRQLTDKISLAIMLHSKFLDKKINFEKKIKPKKNKTVQEIL